MKRNVVNLTVHKNTIKKRRYRALKSKFLSEAKQVVRNPDTTGYCIVAWNDNGDMNYCWNMDDGSPIIAETLPCYLQTVIAKEGMVKKDETD